MNYMRNNRKYKKKCWYESHHSIMAYDKLFYLEKKTALNFKLKLAINFFFYLKKKRFNLPKLNVFLWF